MSDTPTPPKAPASPQQDARAERLAQQLRENLRRRKAQAKRQNADDANG